MSEFVPPPPHPRVSNYPRRAAAWVTLMVEPALVRAVLELAEYPLAAGRVAWVSALAIAAARGREETHVPLSMSAVIPAPLLAEVFPDQATAQLRSVALDIGDAPSPAVLRRRLEHLAQAGPHLPVHFLRP
ncbi:hypothetical protein ABZ234_08600 [Nocardiopsis sp. NPDC006198]|uniref:hypothetical protein n=1 Tax=Nocardiopsis sp. NPDC006198 TaxID=3154472 RepID=UPI0033B71808